MNHQLINTLKNKHPNVTIVMASKYLEIHDFQQFIDAGIRDFGENRDTAFIQKKEALSSSNITWHFIGTLQTKKVKNIINDIAVLHTLDRLKLALEIEKYRDTVLPCFIQVNISSEPQKHGINAEEVSDFLNSLAPLKKINVIGLMGMAEDTHDQNIIDAQFKVLTALKTQLQSKYPNLNDLSMGMSQDYIIALKHGATHLRLGRILLEEKQ